jgi:hypothetical protein
VARQAGSIGGLRRVDLGTLPRSRKRPQIRTQKARRHFVKASTPADLSDTLCLAPGFGNHEDRVKKRQSKKRGAGMAVGVAWYREADWPRIKELFPDADLLHETHAEWLKFADESVKRLARTGMTVEPVVIDIDDFLGWCLIHNRPRDAKARTEYVTEKLSHKYPNKGGPAA